MHEHWLFIWNVLTHVVASMSGVASFVMSMWEHTRKQKIESRAFFIVGVLCLIVAFDQAWQDEHRNSQVLIAEKSSITHERDFWEAQSYSKDNNLRDVNKANLEYLKAVTETQKTADGTQKSLTELTEKVFEGTKPAPPRVITNATPLNTVAGTNPSDTTVIVVGTVTRDYPAFRGYLECATPFQLKEGLLGQGAFGISIYPLDKPSTRLPLSFLNATWKPGEIAFALIHGMNLEPTKCAIKQE